MAQKLVVTHAQLAGSPISQSWSYAVALTSDESQEEAHQHQLFVVAQITRTDNEDAAFFGQSIIKNIETTHFHHDGTNEVSGIFNSLKQTLGKISTAIAGEAKHLQTYTVIAAVVVEDKLYAARVGIGNVMLFRADQGFQLFSAIAKDQATPSGETQVVSGLLKPKDYIILGTENFFEHAYPTAQLFDGNNTPQDIADTLSPLLLSLPQNAEVAACIIAAGSPITEPEAIQNEQLVASPQQTNTQTIPPAPPAQEPHLSAIEEHPVLADMPQPQTKPKILASAHKLAQKARPVIYAIRKRKPPLSIRPDDNEGRIGMGFNPLTNKRARKSFLIIMGSLLLIGLLILGYQGLMKFQSAMGQKEAAKLVETAKRNITIAQSVKAQDPKKAEQYLKEAQTLLNKAKSKNSNLAVADLTSTIDQELGAVYAVTAIENPKNFTDLTLIKENINASKLELAQGNMLVVDSQAPTVILVDKAKKTGRIVTGGNNVAKFISAALLGERVIVITQDGLYAINQSNGEAKQLVAKDNLWGTIADIVTYNGNLYLLDNGKNQVWKYAAAGDSFSSIKNFITEPNVDLSKGSDMVIDGTIWVAAGNEVKRVSDGKTQTVQISGIDQPLGSTLKFSTTVDAKNLYIFDKDNKRVVVMSKDGRYVNQYQSPYFAQCVDIAADESNKVLYLLTKNNIAEIPLSQ